MYEPGSPAVGKDCTTAPGLPQWGPAVREQPQPATGQGAARRGTHRRSILPSTLCAVASRMTSTGFCWPMRWQRSMA